MFMANWISLGMDFQLQAPLMLKLPKIPSRFETKIF
jgi:hypothetical protein